MGTKTLGFCPAAFSPSLFSMSCRFRDRSSRSEEADPEAVALLLEAARTLLFPTEAAMYSLEEEEDE